VKDSGVVWVPPFPRLRFRLRCGFWCEHPNMTPWHMIDDGFRQLRRCRACDWTEFR
jgi:hypothetical protein